MTRLIRLGIREERWFLDDAPWLQPGEVPADALRDLQTAGGSLSVFALSEETRVPYLAAAWFAVGPNNQKPDDVGYAVFDHDTLIQLGIKVEPTLGRTADQTLDALHHDILELTVTRLAALAKVIASAETAVVLRKELTALMKEGVD